jgi:hypothetical protein
MTDAQSEKTLSPRLRSLLCTLGRWRFTARLFRAIYLRKASKFARALGQERGIESIKIVGAFVDRFVPGASVMDMLIEYDSRGVEADAALMTRARELFDRFRKAKRGFGDIAFVTTAERVDFEESDVASRLEYRPQLAFRAGSWGELSGMERRLTPPLARFAVAFNQLISGTIALRNWARSPEWAVYKAISQEKLSKVLDYASEQKPRLRDYWPLSELMRDAFVALDRLAFQCLNETVPVVNAKFDLESFPVDTETRKLSDLELDRLRGEVPDGRVFAASAAPYFYLVDRAAARIGLFVDYFAYLRRVDSKLPIPPLLLSENIFRVASLGWGLPQPLMHLSWDHAKLETPVQLLTHGLANLRERVAGRRYVLKGRYVQFSPEAFRAFLRSLIEETVMIATRQLVRDGAALVESVQAKFPELVDMYRKCEAERASKVMVPAQDVVTIDQTLLRLLQESLVSPNPPSRRPSEDLPAPRYEASL